MFFCPNTALKSLVIASYVYVFRFGLEQKVDIAIQAGFDAIEPWDTELATFEKEGGNLKELGKKLRIMVCLYRV